MTGPTSIHAIIPQLLQLIEELALRPGERLPGERELAARLGWSRNTLREASHPRSAATAALPS